MLPGCDHLKTAAFCATLHPISFSGTATETLTNTPGSLGHVAHGKILNKLAYQTRAICQVLNN